MPFEVRSELQLRKVVAPGSLKGSRKCAIRVSSLYKQKMKGTSCIVKKALRGAETRFHAFLKVLMPFIVCPFSL
jgi:hypothetical protein